MSDYGNGERTESSEPGSRLKDAAATNAVMYNLLQSEGWKFVEAAVLVRVKTIESGLYAEPKGMDDMIFKADKIGSIRELKWLLGLPEQIRSHAQATVSNLEGERD